MTPKMINLLGKTLARKLAKESWCCEMRVLRSIQTRHPHWYQRLLSRDLFTWLKITKQPWYYSSTTNTIVYKPNSR